jgi:hypothetical protein
VTVAAGAVAAPSGVAAVFAGARTTAIVGARILGLDDA